MIQILTSEWSLEQALFKRRVVDIDEEHLLLALLLIQLLVSNSELDGPSLARACINQWEESVKLLFGLEL